MSRAPAKIILCGEHAVVYGQPAIAVPFSALGAIVNAEPNVHGGGLVIDAQDIRQTFTLTPPAKTSEQITTPNGLIYAAELTLRVLDLPVPDLILHIRSDIPIGGGMGSGAAVTTALIDELSRMLGKPLDRELLNTLVYDVEKMYHGTPSGVDNTVIVFNQPVYFVRDQSPQPIAVGDAADSPMTLLVADSGLPGSTRETVAHVRRQYEVDPNRVQPLLKQIGVLVDQARSALAAGDWQALGTALNEDHALLQALGVSTAQLDRLTQAARAAGAFGSKLSGGGGGGNVIAVVAADAVQRLTVALREAGAVQVWQTVIKGNQNSEC